MPMLRAAKHLAVLHALAAGKGGGRVVRQSASLSACRWERSQRFGLDPPQAVKQLLENSPASANQNVWAGRT